VSDDPDDEALSWGDENDPTYSTAPAVRGARPSRAERAADRAAKRDVVEQGPVPGSAVAPVSDDAADDADAALPPVTSSAVLLSLGILAGVYLLYTVGWYVSMQRDIAVPVDPFALIMSEFRQYLSIAAPVVWFAATLVLTRRHRAIVRLLWLLLGAVLLVPLPFVMGA
jgi:hypothetical protein